MRCILVGGGKTAYFLARDFISKGYHVTLVVRNGGEATSLSRRVRATVLHGDGSDPELLEEAGARRADVLLALTPHDEDNLVACQLAQRMFGVPRTISVLLRGSTPRRTAMSTVASNFVLLTCFTICVASCRL